MIIVPEMIGSIIGVYNDKTFNQFEIEPEMIAHYLAEFSISYKPVKHGYSSSQLLKHQFTIQQTELDVAITRVQTASIAHQYTSTLYPTKTRFSIFFLAATDLRHRYTVPFEARQHCGTV